ncbi:MAG: flagellar basal body P-ring formation chaperone FlgA, partial [Desulfuromonadaceae bacterium]
MITLSDLAELSGPATDHAELQLLPSPKPGQQQTYSIDTIKKALGRHAVPLDEVSWTGATSITVHRAGLLIDQTTLENILNEYLDSKRDFLPQARITFQAQRFPQPFFLPQGKLTPEVIPSDPQILHSRRFSIIFRIDDQVVENLSINGKLEAIAPVLVVATDLERGSLLSSQDLNLAELDIVRLRNPCFDADEVVGKKLKRSLRQGTPLDRGNVEFPPMVTRGELVTITLRHGPLALNARGEARQSGKEGE